ncbi:MAG TPA: hypothetical protein VFA75_21420 [Nevskia sp.]|nr:hypothetical protein [Nevskia sp.]
MLPAFAREQQAIQRHRRAVRLADGLLLALRVNAQGRDLVAWLADAGCRDNRDALVTWVVKQLKDAAPDPGAAELFTLMERLTRHLNRVAEGANYAQA